MVLTDKETRLLALAWVAAEEPPKVNFVYLAALTGMTLGSTKSTLGYARKHAKELKEKDETIVDYSLGTGKGPKNSSTKTADPKPGKGRPAKVNKNEVKENDSNNDSMTGASAPAAKSKAKAKSATRKSPIIKKEQHDLEPEDGEQADEEDNAGSGAVTDATPLATQTSNIHLEQEVGDTYSDMYGDGDRGQETLSPDVNTAKGTGRKRPRGDSQRKVLSIAPTPPSECNDEEPPTPSKKVKPSPKPVLKTSNSNKNGGSTSLNTKVVKNGGGNEPISSASSQAYDEFVRGDSKKSALSTDGANDIGDSIVVAGNKKSVASPLSSDKNTHTKSNGQTNKRGTSDHAATPIQQSTSKKPSKKTSAQYDVNTGANTISAADSATVWHAVNKPSTISNPTTPAPATPSAPAPIFEEASTVSTRPAKPSKKYTKKAAFTTMTPSRSIGSNNANGKSPTVPAVPSTPAFKAVEVVLPIARPRTPTPASGSNSKLARRDRGDIADLKAKTDGKENANDGEETKPASAAKEKAKAKNANTNTNKTKARASELAMVNGRWTTANKTHEQNEKDAQKANGNAKGPAGNLFIPDSDSAGEGDAEDSMGDTICVDGKDA
ncbi:MAG: hypothetical protein Q9160_004402 [Pyrenula sp. 1 TL-2023]